MNRPLSIAEEDFSLTASRSANRSTVLVVTLYLLFYFLASFLDHSTTSLALQSSGAHEGNVVSSSQGYVSTRAWAITVIAAFLLAGCVAFAVRHADRTEEIWLQHPVRSFGLFYVNPWAGTAMGRSPIHMLSFALAFPLLRILAAVNNLMIHFYGVAPIGTPIEWIAKRSSPLVGFVVVLVVLFYLLAIAVSPIAARLISSWRNEPV